MDEALQHASGVGGLLVQVGSGENIVLLRADFVGRAPPRTFVFLTWLLAVAFHRDIRDGARQYKRAEGRMVNRLLKTLGSLEHRGSKNNHISNAV